MEQSSELIAHLSRSIGLAFQIGNAGQLAKGRRLASLGVALPALCVNVAETITPSEIREGGEARNW